MEANGAICRNFVLFAVQCFVSAFNRAASFRNDLRQLLAICRLLWNDEIHTLSRDFRVDADGGGVAIFE